MQSPLYRTGGRIFTQDLGYVFPGILLLGLS